MKKRARGEWTEAEKRVARIRDRIKERWLHPYLRRACSSHHVTEEEILGASRKFARPRMALFRMLHDEAELSWTSVAELFEKKHDAIMHSTGYRESRARREKEQRVVLQIVGYIRQHGEVYEQLARDIEAGSWRPTAAQETAAEPGPCSIPE